MNKETFNPLNCNQFYLNSF